MCGYWIPIYSSVTNWINHVSNLLTINKENYGSMWYLSYCWRLFYLTFSQYLVQMLVHLVFRWIKDLLMFSNDKDSKLMLYPSFKDSRMIKICGINYFAIDSKTFTWVVNFWIVSSY